MSDYKKAKGGKLAAAADQRHLTTKASPTKSLPKRKMAVGSMPGNYLRLVVYRL
jgi:hypothetical protein